MNEPTRRAAVSALRMAAAVDAVAAGFLLPLVLLLLIHAATPAGRLCACAALSGMAVLPAVFLAARWKKARRAGVIAASVLGVAVVVLLGACYALTPDGEARPGSPVRSQWLGTARYQRLSPANLVPEVDQLTLASYVLPYLDPFVDGKQAVRIRRLFLDVYRDMHRSPEFVRLGSVMNYTYRDMFLHSRPTGHLYEYVPTIGGDRRLPVILFLHGSLGNFKGYLWVWKRFADRNGFAIVAPTFGMGDWDKEGGVEAIQDAREYCLKHPRMDGRRIYLAGLSNGGKGVTRGGRQSPEAYKGLVFISPIIEDAVTGSDRFVNGWKGRRILVLHGLVDRRIPFGYIQGSVSRLSSRGACVEAKFYTGEDHFLFFSKPDEVLGDVAEWIEDERHKK